MTNDEIRMACLEMAERVWADTPSGSRDRAIRESARRFYAFVSGSRAEREADKYQLYEGREALEAASGEVGADDRWLCKATPGVLHGFAREAE